VGRESFTKKYQDKRYFGGVFHPHNIVRNYATKEPHKFVHQSRLPAYPGILRVCVARDTYPWKITTVYVDVD